MKTSAIVVLVVAFTTAGGLAVMNKACKTSLTPGVFRRSTRRMERR